MAFTGIHGPLRKLSPCNDLDARPPAGLSYASGGFTHDTGRCLAARDTRRRTARPPWQGRHRPRTRLRGHRRGRHADAARPGHQGPADAAEHRPVERHLGHDRHAARGRDSHADHGTARRSLRQAADAARQPFRHGDRLADLRVHRQPADHDRRPRAPGLRHGRHPARHRHHARRAAPREARLGHGTDELLHRRRRRTRPAGRGPGGPARRLARPVLRRRRSRRHLDGAHPRLRTGVLDPRPGQLRHPRCARPLGRSGLPAAADHQGLRLGLDLRHHARTLQPAHSPSCCCGA